MYNWLLEYVGKEKHWGREMHHWRLMIKYTGASWDYWQGLGLKEPPTIQEILGSLASEWAALNEYGDKEFIEQFGYNEQEGKDIVNAIKADSAKLKRFFTLDELKKYIKE